MTHISNDELAELRAILETEKKSLEEELGQHGRKINGDWVGTPSGFGSGEPDEIDAADRMEELANNIPLVEELERRHTEVVQALSRMDADTYGITDEGEEIPLARLRANPAARTNI